MTTEAPKQLGLWEMLRMRHSGDAWIFVEEVGNGTGTNVSRHADALALGLWPSRGYEIHGYEVKISRGDVRRELDDPSKADAVGKFCDYWWLVVQDLSIIDGLIIPSTWGILYPKNRVLRVHRKAPKREAKEVNRAFAAALIRKALKSWVPLHQHAELKETALEKAKQELERNRGHSRSEAERQLADLKSAVANFERHTGVDITSSYKVAGGAEESFPLNSWQLDRIGKAVKIVMDARAILGEFRGADSDDPAQIVESEIDKVDRAIATLEQLTGNRRASRDQLRDMLERMRADVVPAE